MLPEVESSRRLPFPRSPFASAVRIMFSAGLSLTEPPGLNHSALAKTCIRGDRFEASPERVEGSRGEAGEEACFQRERQVHPAGSYLFELIGSPVMS